MFLRFFCIIFIIIIISGCKQTKVTAEENVKWEIKKILSSGGRVSWYKGEKHELIAYDRVTDEKTRNTGVFTMKPDGTDIKYITESSVVPEGFVGQPAWHPDGEHLLIQVENKKSRHTRYEHMSWGINNDLWLINRHGTSGELIYPTTLNNAVLHPHFNQNGTKIIFAERIATGESFWYLKPLNTPGGENPWIGWQIHIADFDINKKGTGKLLNHRVIKPDGEGFYETHGFTESGKIVYSHTDGGEGYVDDIYTVNIDGSEVINLINSPKTWDEHGHYSPGGKTLAFISSRFDTTWKAPGSKATELKTELYILNKKGVKKITEFNKNTSFNKRYIVSDFDWDREGKRIIFQVGFIKGLNFLSVVPEIWMITFPEKQ